LEGREEEIRTCSISSIKTKEGGSLHKRKREREKEREREREKAALTEMKAAIVVLASLFVCSLFRSLSVSLSPSPEFNQ
jgi:hypothetical protein